MAGMKKYVGGAQKLESIPEIAAQKPTGTRPKVQAEPNLCPKCLGPIAKGIPHKCSAAKISYFLEGYFA